MKIKLLILSLLLALSSTVLLVSCIAEAPLEIECDIEEISVQLENPLDIFDQESYATYRFLPIETKHVFSVKHNAALGSYPVYIKTSKGSTAFIVIDGEEVPFENGRLVNFTNERVQKFVIRCESGEWSKTYEVSMEHQPAYTVLTEMLITFNGNYTIQGKTSTNPGYYVWTETDPVITKNLFRAGDPVWKNGNPGFILSRGSAQPDEYPTIPVFNGGMDGSDCVELHTRSTGSFGQMVHIPLAAGSMFNGLFDSSKALNDARKATRMGVPCPHKPIRIEADLRYEPGPKFQDSNENEITGVVDEPDLYCIIYRNADENGNAVVLDGDDVLTNKHIKGVARLKHNYNMVWNEEEQRHIPEPVLTNSPIHGITNEWQHVSIPVNYDFFQTGHENVIDPILLRNRGYSIVIGSTSSWRGGYFEGALDSKLYMDNVKVVFEDPEDEGDTTLPIASASIIVDDPLALFPEEGDSIQYMEEGTTEIVFPVKWDADMTSVPLTLHPGQGYTVYDEAGKVFVSGTKVDLSKDKVLKLKARDAEGKLEIIYTVRAKFEDQPVPTILSACIKIASPLTIFNNVGDSVQTPSASNEIIFPVRWDAVVTAVPLTLNVSKWATVQDAGGNSFVSGSNVDLSDGQFHQFKVFSEDGTQTNTYKVKVKYAEQTEFTVSSFSIVVNNPLEIFKQATDSVQTANEANEVVFPVRWNADVTAVPLTIHATKFSTIYDENEEVFTSGQKVNLSDGEFHTFTVKSRFGKKTLTYKVRADIGQEPRYVFSFENGNTSSGYYTWTDANLASSWVTTNPMFKVLRTGASASECPARKDGTSVLLLETAANNSTYASMLKMRTVPGMLFNGTMDSYSLQQAMSGGLSYFQSLAHYGAPFKHKPTKMKVRAKYIPGEKYYKGNTYTAGETDSPDIYCVFYRNMGGQFVLSATDLFTHGNIAGYVRLHGSSKQVGTTWTDLEFKIETYNVDAAALADGGYSMVIGATSSWNGHNMEGAEGSKLYIESITIFYED